MTCNEIEARLSDYLERSLDAKDGADVEAHLKGCPSCEALRFDVEQIIALCHAFPTVEPTQQLVNRILQRTAGRKRFVFRILPLEWTFRSTLSGRLAIGIVLGFFFVSFVANYLGARFVGLAETPGHVIKKADIFTHRLYSRALKVYDKTAQWQSELQFFTSSLLGKIDYRLNQFEEQLSPAEKEEKIKKKEKDKQQKSSIELLSA